MGPEQVGLITGASSGIGFALTNHLLSKGWHIIMADLQPPPSSFGQSNEKVLYIPCDVSSWEAQAAMFKKAYGWKQHFDFAALNAGTGENDVIYRRDSDSDTAAKLPAEPPKPSMLTFDINLYAVYYGVALFQHYNQLATEAGTASSAKKKIVITASSAGLYSSPALPQYCAAKHALVGLTRSLAPTSLATANTTVNCFCPGYVSTKLTAGIMLDAVRANGHETPMSTIMRAYDELMDEDAGRNGSVLECSADNSFYRQQLEFSDEHMEWLFKGSQGLSGRHRGEASQKETAAATET